MDEPTWDKYPKPGCFFMSTGKSLCMAPADHAFLCVDSTPYVYPVCTDCMTYALENYPEGSFIPFLHTAYPERIDNDFYTRNLTGDPEPNPA